MTNDQGPGPEVPDRWRVYDEPKGSPKPEPGDDPGPAAPATWVPDNTPPAAARRPSDPSGAPSLAVAIVIALVVVAVVVGAGTLLLSFRDGGVVGVGGSPDAQTTEGFAELVRDIEEETGSTTVFWVGLYDGYAVVDVPYADDDRELSYRWDGGFDEPRKGTSTDERFDIADVDPAVVDGMCDEVLAMVEDPENCYIFIDKPDPRFGSEAWIRTSASNEFGQNAVIEYDLEGNEVGRHEP